jgi:hypothetical protein
MGDFGENDSISNIHVLGGGAASELGTAMALLGSINNPLSNQIIMNAERPKFQGTAENFSEFRRKWKEYHRLIKGNSPTTNEGQILHLFQQRLDKPQWGKSVKMRLGFNPSPLGRFGATPGLVIDGVNWGRIGERFRFLGPHKLRHLDLFPLFHQIVSPL